MKFDILDLPPNERKQKEYPLFKVRKLIKEAFDESIEKYDRYGHEISIKARLSGNELDYYEFTLNSIISKVEGENLEIVYSMVEHGIYNKSVLVMLQMLSRIKTLAEEAISDVVPIVVKIKVIKVLKLPTLRAANDKFSGLATCLSDYILFSTDEILREISKTKKLPKYTTILRWVGTSADAHKLKEFLELSTAQWNSIFITEKAKEKVLKDNTKTAARTELFHILRKRK